MDVGFETIGNATLIVHDQGPLLVTDPWVDGHAYFGSWTMSHEIPSEQLEAIAAAKFVWLSHGHPDHLHYDSLFPLRSKTILLPDHVGNRIKDFLTGGGFSVQVLSDRTWCPLSDHVAVQCVADYNQDAALLVDISGVLVVNVNDSSLRGSRTYVRKVIGEFPVSVGLFGAPGDVDMINYWDDRGNRLPPPAHDKELSGRMVAQRSAELGVRYCIPFSAMHRYQRADSVWASEFTTDPGEYALGFRSPSAELIPPYSQVDLGRGFAVQPINPAERPLSVSPPEEFGDDWSDQLDRDDVVKATSYFQSIAHVARHYDFINLRVGNADNVITLRSRPRAGRQPDVGITFEVPRASLMQAIRYQVFDDLLIGNFMKTTLHGAIRQKTLHPHFSPYVGKYADNGGARSDAEVRAYLSTYRARDPLGYFRDQLTASSSQFVRTYLPQESIPYRGARAVYRQARRVV